MTTHAIGRYQLLDVLGQGGMAVVYRAYDATLNREVALKLLAIHLVNDSGFYQRFEREARIVATLEHPGIVPVYDFGVDEQRRPYLVMRLLRGGTLRERSFPGKPAEALWPAMRQVAAGLDYAHGRNVVHRDVKPANVLFDEKGNAYISDFGIAKVRDVPTSELTGHALLGTPAYMSPEQFDNRPVDGGSDQYSLAIVLFEALTGRLPFGGDTPNVLMNQHLYERPADAHTLNPALPPAVSAVLARALAKEPAARYPDVTAFVHELEAAAYQRLSPAAPASRTEAEERRLEGYYQAGVQAYQRSDWSAAVAHLGRVTSIQAEYRDAARLRQVAMQRLQDMRDAPVAPPPLRPAPLAERPTVRAPALAQPRRPANRRLLLVLGVAALVVLAFMAYVLWPRGGPEPTATIEAAGLAAVEDVVAPATLVPGEALEIQVGAADGARIAGQSEALASGAKVTLPPGESLRLTGGEGSTELTLPGGPMLTLDEGAEVTIALDEAGAVGLTLHGGRLLAQGEAAAVVQSAKGAWAALEDGGLLGVNLNPTTLLFEAACLKGTCRVAGEQDTDARQLDAGQAAIVGSSGRVGQLEEALYVPYLLLAPAVVPTPTATPTRTPTAMPTPSRTPLPRSTAVTTTVVATDSPNAETATASSDSDGDGVYYLLDLCPNRYGSPTNNGCPPDPPTGTSAAPTQETVTPPNTPEPTHYPYP